MLVAFLFKALIRENPRESVAFFLGEICKRARRPAGVKQLLIS
jgi:hypothetical protein